MSRLAPTHKEAGKIGCIKMPRYIFHTTDPRHVGARSSSRMICLGYREIMRLEPWHNQGETLGLDGRALSRSQRTRPLLASMDGKVALLVMFAIEDDSVPREEEAVHLGRLNALLQASAGFNVYIQLVDLFDSLVVGGFHLQLTGAPPLAFDSLVHLLGWSPPLDSGVPSPPGSPGPAPVSGLGVALRQGVPTRQAATPDQPPATPAAIPSADESALSRVRQKILSSAGSLQSPDKGGEGTGKDLGGEGGEPSGAEGKGKAPCKGPAKAKGKAKDAHRGGAEKEQAGPSKEVSHWVSKVSLWES